MMIAPIIPASAHGTHSALMSRLDERLAEQPLSGDLWYRRAVLEFEHEDWAAAALDFEKAERYAPGELPVLWWQGRILDKQGNSQEAKSAPPSRQIPRPNRIWFMKWRRRSRATG